MIQYTIAQDYTKQTLFGVLTKKIRIGIVCAQIYSYIIIQYIIMYNSN